MNRGRVWVVDDSALFLELCTRTLGGQFDVVCFRSGASMLEALGGGEAPDLLVLDWLMPEMSGRDLCHFVRERLGALELPIIIVTSGRENVVEGLEAGANDYVTKPYQAEELTARVRTLVALRQLHSKLAVAENELREEAAFRERFIGVLAHDLQQPLHAVSLAMHLLANPARTQASGAAGAGLRATQRMTRMVDELLDFTRSRSGGGIPVERREAVLGDIVRRVIDDHGHHAAIHFVSEGDTSGAWDADRITQVCENLIGNAIAHGAPGAPVSVRVVASESDVALEVHNKGQPIAPDAVSSLFDPFRSGINAPEKGARRGFPDGVAHAGLGLGLFIVDQIVRAHGGSVRVRSSADEGGTTFIASMPRVARHAPG